MGHFCVFEVGLSVVEMLVGEGVGYGGFDGTVNGIKHLLIAIPVMFYVFLTMKYALKISASLKAGGSSGAAASKGILKCKLLW